MAAVATLPKSNWSAHTKRIGLMVLASSVAVACRTHSGSGWEAIRGPDGDTWYVARCRGDLTNCYIDIGDACQYGYVAAKESERDTGSLTTYNRVGGTVWGTTSTGHRGSVIFQCKPAPGSTARVAASVSDASTGGDE